MTLVADLADRGINPAEAPYDCRLEVDREEHQAVIVWTEDLAFHAELAQADEDRWPRTTVNRWEHLTVNGWLKAEVEQALATELERLIAKDGGPAVTVWRSESGYDEPSVTFEVVTDYIEGEKYEAWLDRIGWPVVATIINSTDPGTFMFPYLFSAILYRPVGAEA